MADAVLTLAVSCGGELCVPQVRSAGEGAPALPTVLGYWRLQSAGGPHPRGWQVIYSLSLDSGLLHEVWHHNLNLKIIFFKKRVFIYLKELKRERKKQIIHPLVHSPEGHTGSAGLDQSQRPAASSGSPRPGPGHIGRLLLLSPGHWWGARSEHGPVPVWAAGEMGSSFELCATAPAPHDS